MTNLESLLTDTDPASPDRVTDADSAVGRQIYQQLLGRLGVVDPSLRCGDPRRASQRARRDSSPWAPRRLVVAVLVVALSAAILAPALLVNRSVGNSGSSRPHTTTVTPGPAPPVTVAQLASGRWSTMRPAPITSRGGAAVVWTGHELLVWGGSSGPTGPLRSDGAAYNPTTKRWRVLPQSPLRATAWASAIWTGSEMVIFGGYTDESMGELKVTNAAAAYDPATNRWQTLPPAPLSPRADTIALWTGKEVIVLGGRPAVTPPQASSRWDGDWTYGNPPTYGDGAAFDPSTGRWQHIGAPAPPRGHQLAFQTVVQTGDELLAFSLWSEFHSLGQGTIETVYGSDLFAYDLSSGDWRAIGDWRDVPARPDMVTVPEEALSTGGGVIVRGAPYECLFCNLVPPPEVTDLYDPARNTWTGIAPDPPEDAGLISVWTGDALFSFDPTASDPPSQVRPPGASVVRGAASLYVPATARWTLLPRAPLGCSTSGIPNRGVIYSYPSPIWTGQQILIYCPQFGDSPTTPAGLIYTPGGSGTARGPVEIGIELDSTRVTAGTPIHGEAVVTNTTGKAITVKTCAADGWLFVGLTNSRVVFNPVSPTPAFPESLRLVPGVNRFPITVSTKYQVCTQSTWGPADVPACTPTGAPPLPAGTYVTAVIDVGLPAGTQLPLPTTVRLLAARG